MNLLRIALLAGLATVAAQAPALDLDDSDGNGVSDVAETEIDSILSLKTNVAREDLLAFARVFFTLLSTQPTDPAFNGAAQQYARELDCLQRKYPRDHEALKQGVISGTLANFERNKAYAVSHNATEKYLKEAMENNVEFRCPRK